MRLPGGHLNPDGRLTTQVDFRPLDGHVELAIAAAGTRSRKVEAVTAVLTAAIMRIGDERPQRDALDALSVGDRNALMIRLGVLAGYRTAWVTAPCAACGKPFDFEIDYAGIPMADAPAGYPFADVVLGNATPEDDADGAVIRVRVPTGRDQLRCGDSDPHALIDAIIVSERPNDGLSDTQYAAIDEALSELMPGPPLVAQATCPDCATVNQVPIDAAAWLSDFDSRPLDDVHEIARVYHWSEDDILSLSRDRRSAYLRRIASDRTAGG